MPEPWPDAGAVTGAVAGNRDRKPEPGPEVGARRAALASHGGKEKIRFWLASDLGVPRDKPRGGANCEKDPRPNR